MKNVSIRDYSYILPKSQVAQFPLEDRSSSKLLIYRDNTIIHDVFHHIPSYISSDTVLFFNNTRVIPARLLFKNDKGDTIEIFLLYPISPSGLIEEAINAKKQTIWVCMIRNLKRWKIDQALERHFIINDDRIIFQAILIDKERSLIHFKWNTYISFIKIIETLGIVPLPPYINRRACLEDKELYQTVYGNILGAVAAPTAGLHFTKSLISLLKNRLVIMDKITLHVNAGTFKPIYKEDIHNHQMHREQMTFNQRNIDILSNSYKVMAVGTTSLRALESIYWFGINLLRKKKNPFYIPKLMPYEYKKKTLPSFKELLHIIQNWMTKHNKKEITIFTEIFIFTGYSFKVCDALITNFHQPRSTLILLVAAFLGEERWKEIYSVALKEKYRFLSYGDSSLLFRS